MALNRFFDKLDDIRTGIAEPECMINSADISRLGTMDEILVGAAEHLALSHGMWRYKTDFTVYEKSLKGDNGERIKVRIHDYAKDGEPKWRIEEISVKKNLLQRYKPVMSYSSYTDASAAIPDYIVHGKWEKSIVDGYNRIHKASPAGFALILGKNERIVDAEPGVKTLCYDGDDGCK